MFNVTEKKILYQLIANENIVKTMQRISQSAQGLNNDLNRVGRNITNNFSNINSMITKTSNNFEKMRKTMMRLSSVVFLPLAFMGSREYLRSEKAIAMYDVIQDKALTLQEKKNVYKNATNIGKMTGQSQSSIIELATELEKGGLKSAILTGTRGSVLEMATKIKAITGQTSQEVGNMLLSIISAYGLKNLSTQELEKKLPVLVSKYIKAANLSKFNYSDIEALTRKSPNVLKMAGFDEDYIIAIQSVLSNSTQPSVTDRALASSVQRLSNLPYGAKNFLKRYTGIDVNKLKKSGTSMQDIFQSILKSVDVIASLDIKNFDPNDTNFRNLMKFSKMSRKQFKELDSKEFKNIRDNFLTELLSQTFGKDFSPKMSNLATNIKSILDATTEIKKIKDDELLQETYKRSLPPLQKAFSKLGVSFNEFFNNLMKAGLEDKVIGLLEKLTKFFDYLAKDDKLLKNLAEITAGFTQLMVVLGGISILFKTYGLISGVVGTAGKVGKALGKGGRSAMKFPVKNPLVMLGVAGAVTGGALLNEYGLLDRPKQFISDLWDDLSKKFSDDAEKKKTDINVNIQTKEVSVTNNDNYNVDVKLGEQSGF